MTPEAPLLYVYRRPARRMLTGFVTALVLVLLLAAWLWFEAAGWLMLALSLFTLPALFELVTNPAAGLDLSALTLRWFSGRRQAEVALAEIEHVRLDTRLDFSVRASVVLRTGRKIRLPFEATPPHMDFESALEETGIKVVRHHFQLLQ